MPLNLAFCPLFHLELSDFLWPQSRPRGGRERGFGPARAKDVRRPGLLPLGAPHLPLQTRAEPLGARVGSGLLPDRHL